MERTSPDIEEGRLRSSNFSLPDCMLIESLISHQELSYSLEKPTVNFVAVRRSLQSYMGGKPCWHVWIEPADAKSWHIITRIYFHMG